MNQYKQYISKAIENILKEGITDVDLFSDFFEVSILKDDSLSKKLINRYSSLLAEPFEKMAFNKNNYFLFPKSDFTSYRKCALIQITDEIKYLALVLSIAKEIEAKRIKKSCNTVFSYRYQADLKDYLFDSHYNYQSFRNEVGKIISEGKCTVMISCDISNFYDRINIHRLISKLYTISKRTDVITKIEQLLLFWADRNSYSLPVGSNASRILAEAALIDVDKFLLDHKIRYVRFVDDFRIFCKDVVEAQKILNMLINRLDQEGLYLNSKKTKFVDLTKEGDKFHYIYKSNSDLSEEERRERLRIIRGYNGSIPTKFKKLSCTEILKFQSVDSLELYKETTAKVVLESNDIVYLIKVLIANKRFDLFLNSCSIMKKFPQLIPYYISAFNKNLDSMTDDVAIDKMKKEYLELLSKCSDYPDFILIYITRLFEGDQKYTKRLFDVYMNSPRSINPYYGRRLLEAMEGNLERYQLLELKGLISAVSLWEKREIIKCLKTGLYEDEFKPIFKDYLITNCDELFFDNSDSNLIS